MHGLINRSVQCFVRDTYGQQVWSEVAMSVGIGVEGFESMLNYEDSLTEGLLGEASRILDKPEDMLLEDLGTYLVSHPNTESVRRLLRFGGETFSDFLHSLDDLPDRAHLAVPELELPELEVLDEPGGQSVLVVRHPNPGFACVLLGVLRALADDYGVLAFLDLERAGPSVARVTISVLDDTFAEGRSFSLAQPERVGTGAVP